MELISEHTYQALSYVDSVPQYLHAWSVNHCTAPPPGRVSVSVEEHQLIIFLLLNDAKYAHYNGIRNSHGKTECMQREKLERLVV